ncbi:hypothetical protein D3C78_1115450 [compost metagenome]
MRPGLQREHAAQRPIVYLAGSSFTILAATEDTDVTLQLVLSERNGVHRINIVLDVEVLQLGMVVARR